jgi:cytochrome bd-type quinol oxidase subunit 2
MKLELPAYLAIIAFGITTAFVLFPTPYLMLAFAFFAQPLFLMVVILYLRRVFRELREKEVI